MKIAESNGKLEGDRDVVRFQQTNLGRLIATAHMERAKADFAVMNSGGVRDSIEAGDITYKDVLTVQPFGNMVSYVDMSGQEVLDYLTLLQPNQLIQVLTRSLRVSLCVLKMTKSPMYLSVTSNCV